jgi:hypothetical protein
VPRLLLPGVQLQIKLTKYKSDFYVLSIKADAGSIFKFPGATLHLRHVKPFPNIQLAHSKAVEKVNACCDMFRVGLNTFIFGGRLEIRAHRQHGAWNPTKTLALLSASIRGFLSIGGY